MKTLQILALMTIIVALLCFLGYTPEASSMSTLYTVSGIFFSIGLSLIIAFDLSPIKNLGYLKSIRKNLSGLRSDYIKWFSISTGSYLVFTYVKEKPLNPGEALMSIPYIVEHHPKSLEALLVDLSPIVLNISLSVQLIAILFFIINFLETQKFKDKLSDKIRDEQEN